MNDNKTQCAEISKFFKKQDQVNHQFYNVIFAEAENGPSETVFVIIQLFSPHFSDNFCDINRFVELEMDTSFFYLTPAKEQLSN